jgi:hypothetical protein
VLITALGAPELRAQEVEVDMPSALLKGIGFTVRVSTPVSLDTLPVVLRTADGRVLAESVLPPVGEVAFRDIVVEDRAALPLILTVGGHREELAAPFLPAWFSLLPPLMAIALALIFHEVVSSLFLGIWLGCVFLAGYNPFAAFFMTIDRYIMPALADTDHASIVVFSLLLGGMVGVMTRMGGTQAIVEAVTPLATSRRRAQLATWLAGLAIFFDDYANTLLVGNTMRPLTDKRLVSREKLAYIVDSTAAPVSAIVFVSTWVGYEISLIDDGMRLAVEQGVATGAAAEQLSATSAFGVFLMSIPYLFYPILAIFAVALFILSKRDFGPMLAAERRTVSGGGVHRRGNWGRLPKARPGGGGTESFRWRSSWRPSWGRCCGPAPAGWGTPTSPASRTPHGTSSTTPTPSPRCCGARSSGARWPSRWPPRSGSSHSRSPSWPR